MCVFFFPSTILKPSLRPFSSYLEKSSGGLKLLVKEKFMQGLWDGLVNLLQSSSPSVCCFLYGTAKEAFEIERFW